MRREMFVTVGTGRDREDIGKALALSIRHHRADRVWCLATLKSQEETLPIIRRELGGEGPPLEVLLVEDENDAELCQRQFQKAITGRVAAGTSPSDMIADYTSGTKAMSAGLFAAAVAARVESISYIAGRRDEGGRVIPGTERLTTFTPRTLFAQEELEQATWLFNRFRFEEAAHLAARAGSCGDADIVARARVLEALSRAFGAWDRFDHTTAFRELDGLGKDPRLNLWGMSEAVERSKQTLYQIKARPFCPERLADLSANAWRRLEEGKYDDAVARCYRGFEYLAQLRLSSLGLDPADLQWDAVREKLRAERRDEWQARTYGKDRLILGLRNDYELLRDLDDPLGASFCTAYFAKHSPLHIRLDQRNNSILAHGTDSVGREAALELLDLLSSFAGSVFPRWSAMIERIRFPRLSPGVADRRGDR